MQSRTVPVRLYLLPACAKVLRVCVWSRERDRWCPRKSLLHLPCITESYAPSSPLASYTSPYVREHQVGLSSVLSLSPLSFSLYRPVYVCVERERVLVVHTYSLSLLQSYTHRETQTHTISCCSITGRWILFIMALRSCFLLHSMGLARKPAYALSSRAMIGFFLFRTTHTHICSGLHTRIYTPHRP